ncbi:MAG TPA: cyclic nucleotide-binding domain-containing protein [Polyangiaceae bacterium]|jgi:CRP-like cAMP-binding protein|nr:cyclic nucleotide-binding domain-containing protein [Polyangiaceae bacterium]
MQPESAGRPAAGAEARTSSERDRIERELFLRSTIGRNLPSTRELAELLRDVAFQAGQVVYREGEDSDEIYFVRRGTVGLSRGGVVHEFGPGSVIGILDVEQDKPHARTATALTDVELLSLSSEDRLELLEDSFEHTRSLIRMTATRLDEDGRQGGAEVDLAVTLAPKPEPLLLIERVFTLRDTPAFRKASIQALVSLAPSADEIRLAAGELLFERGEARGVLFVTVAGCLELQGSEQGSGAPRPGTAHRYGSASLLGGGPAFADALSRHSARALTPAVVLRIREEDFYDVMEDHFDLARSVLSYLASENERRLAEAERAPGPPQRGS